VSFTLEEFEEWTSDSEDYSDFYWDDLNGGYRSYDNTPFGKIEWVETDSEYDEGRQDLAMVFKVGDRFFRKHGYYDSWAGGAWDGALEEVRPREKMMTVYDAI
jgi:hypothetical protein